LEVDDVDAGKEAEVGLLREGKEGFVREGTELFGERNAARNAG
jgi:hypothetical protein